MHGTPDFLCVTDLCTWGAMLGGCAVFLKGGGGGVR